MRERHDVSSFLGPKETKEASVEFIRSHRHAPAERLKDDRPNARKKREIVPTFDMERAYKELDVYFGTSAELLGLSVCDPSSEFVEHSGINEVENSIGNLIDGRSNAMVMNRNVHNALATCSERTRNVLENVFTVPHSRFEKLSLIMLGIRSMIKRDKNVGTSEQKAKAIWKRLIHRKANVFDLVPRNAFVWNEDAMQPAIDNAKATVDACVKEFMEAWNRLLIK